MSHKTAKKARQAARAAGIRPQSFAQETTHTVWKPTTRRGVTAERPHVKLLPGSFKDVVKKLKLLKRSVKRD